MKRALIAAPIAAMLTAVVLVGAGGCETINQCEGIACGPCQSPIVLTLRTLDGSKIEHATVTGTLQATCNSFETISTCMLGDSGTKPGTYTMTVVADGYQHVEVTITVAKNPLADDPDVCCACGYKTSRRTINLTKL